MEAVSLVKELSELIMAHDLPIHIEDEWVVPMNKLPAIRATWYPREDSGLLEIEVLLEDNEIIIEGFSGIGAGRQGINSALQNFCVNSFHVFLAAFWGVDDPDQVMTENWKIQDKEYTVFIGNFGTRGSDEMVIPDIPEHLFESIENAIKSEPLKNSLSWFRCFFCDVSGEQTFEALKNNEVWDSGFTALQSLPWKTTNGYYSVRNFLIVRENS